MHNPFEGGPEPIWAQLGDTEEAELEVELRTQVALIDSIQPTGDPIADARKYDEVTNNGRLKHQLDSREAALRHLVEERQDYLTAAPLDPDTEPVPAQICAKNLEAASRLLDYYGIS